MHYFQVRLTTHILERLWLSNSSSTSKRSFNHIRHSMHFFFSNLLYYLQVDVVDSQFAQFLAAVMDATEFQTVQRAHRSFLADVSRLSLIDNMMVQECIERILQVCLRFVALSRLLQQQEADIYSYSSSSNRRPPLIIPPEELTAIHSEFLTQLSHLFQVMRTVENRGFLFRLDFNGFISNLVAGK